jgi:hypothetical protein
MTLSSFQVVAVLVATGIPATGGKPQQKPGDPQSTYEPRSKPGVGQKFMEKLVGDWDVDKTFFPRSGDPVRMKGECRQIMKHDGRFLQSEFVFEYRGSKSSGLGILGFEAETGLFTSVWTDSRSTRMSMRQSQEPFKGEEIVLYGRSLSDAGQNPRRSRTVTRLEEEGRKIVHRQYAPSPDGKDWLMMELVMTRKGKAPSPGR